jgi:hypothetical protein
LNLGATEAGILISLPVCGFLPVLAALLAVSKVPKPISCTLSFFLSCVETTSTKALTAASESFLERPVFLQLLQLILFCS